MDARNGNTEGRHAVASRRAATVQFEAVADPSPHEPHAAQMLVSTDQREEVVEHIGTPHPSIVNHLWLIVIVAFAIVLVGSFLTLAWTAEPDVMLTIFMSVVGFLAGLFTPSPSSR